MNSRATQVGTSGTRGNRRFGDFEILRILGEGGMGAVYLARDCRTDREVALKMPKFSGKNREDTLKRFRREATTAQSLSHPNLCPVHEFGEIHGQAYISLAYIKGVPLSQFLKDSTSISDRQIALLIRKLALAVGAAHRAKIIHRDLKPDNIMINRNREPIVMDFGLARDVDSSDTQLTRTGAFVGTPAYASPEQITNRKGEVDHRTDIYSLGVIMYQMLAGRLPYDASNLVNLIAQLLADDPALPTHHNPAACPRLSEIAMKAIDRDVAHRYQSMNVLANDLTLYLRGETAQKGFTPSESNLILNESLVDQGASLDAESIDFLNVDLDEFRKLEKPVKKRKRKKSRSIRETKLDRSPTTSGRTKTQQPEPKRFEKPADFQAKLVEVVREYPWLVIGIASIFVLFCAKLLFFAVFGADEGRLIVHVTGDVDRPEIQIDGESIDREELNQGVDIETGSHKLVARAAGFADKSVAFTITEGEDTILNLKFDSDGSNSRIRSREVTVKSIVPTTERYKKDLAAADRQLQSNPYAWQTRFARGESYLALGRQEDAIADFSFLIEGDPDKVDPNVILFSNMLPAYRLRAWAKSIQGDRTGVQQDVKTLERLGIDDLEQQGWRAVLSALAGNWLETDRLLESMENPSTEESIELLSLIDPQMDFHTGDWTQSELGVTAPVLVQARLGLPVVPSDHYTLDYLVTPIPNPNGEKDRGLIIGLMLETHRFQLTIDFGNCAVLENIRGANIGNETTRHGVSLPDQKTARIRLGIQPGTVRVQLDGRSLIDWSGKSSDLTTNWSIPKEKVLFVGAWRKNYLVHSILYTPHGGKTEFTKEIGPYRDVQRARWFLLLHQIAERKNELTRSKRYRLKAVELVKSFLTSPQASPERIWNDPVLASLTESE